MSQTPKEFETQDVVPEASTAVQRLRYSVSFVRQGSHTFYTLTVPSDVLARTCAVTTRKEDPQRGFQRELDERRAKEIAQYIDEGLGTIPNSIVLSAQAAAELKIIGKGKTIEFADRPGAFLILDGQHRVFGFSKAKTQLRVPVVIYNGLSRREETRLFIDINTKQRPVPAQLLLDIKRLAEIEDSSEATLRDIFDRFHSDLGSALKDLTAPSEKEKNKLNRATFNSAVKPLLELLDEKDNDQIYKILNNYLISASMVLSRRTASQLLGKPVVFRALMGLFPAIAQRVADRYSGDYSSGNFVEIINPIFSNIPVKKLESPGSSWVQLRNYLDKRMRSKMIL